jgi:hypothetical protein
LHYGRDNATEDTAYTYNKGRFKIAYPNPQQFWYYIYLERVGFLPKTVFIDLSPTDIFLKNPIVLRSRKGFWYDPKLIDSTQLGITVREAFTEYRLDSSECALVDEPPGVYRSFHTEFADSSIVNFSIKSFFSSRRIKMKDIMDLSITGFGITDTNGNERIIGRGFAVSNPYFAERQMRQK